MNTKSACIEWIDDGDGRVPVFFDRRRRLFDPFHDYIAVLAEGKTASASERAYASLVNAVTYALLDWLRFIEEERRDWKSADNKLLTNYRDTALKAVLASEKGKNDTRLAMRTVNSKLQWIYRFYCWAQQDAGLCEAIIGPNRPIHSTITDARTQLDHASSRRQRTEPNRYPLCFKGVSGGSGGVQYFATSEDKRRILELFAKASDPFLAERNRLIVELSDRVGWRAGTVTGLLIDDFSEKALAFSDEGGVSVTPNVQKFALHNRFDIPHALFARVIRYVVLRKRWLVRNGWDESCAQRLLFLNTRTGRPLAHQAIVQLMGRAFRAIGIPPKTGAGHHSFRRKFSDESTSDDLRARKMSGLSTAVEDVMHATALRLGQRSIASQAPYQRAVRDGTRDAEPHRLRNQIKELESAVADKDAKIEELERNLKALKLGKRRSRSE